MVFVTVQNSVGIGAVVSIICHFASLAWKCLFTPLFAWFLGIWPSRWNYTISAKLPNVKSTGHNGFSSELIMLVSIVVSSWGVLRRKPKKKNMNFWEFWISFLNAPDMTTCNFFISMCSFCGEQHTVPIVILDSFCFSLFLVSSEIIYMSLSIPFSVWVAAEQKAACAEVNNISLACHLPSLGRDSSQFLTCLWYRPSHICAENGR